MVKISQFPRLLYLLEREDGALKVGSSSFPARRMRDLEEEQGFNFVLLREWKIEKALAVEMSAHRILRRGGAEWTECGGVETYTVPKAVVMRAVKQAMQHVLGDSPKKGVS